MKCSASKPHGDSTIVQKWFVSLFDKMMCDWNLRFPKERSNVWPRHKQHASRYRSTIRLSHQANWSRSRVVSSVHVKPRSRKPMMNSTVTCCGSRQVQRPESQTEPLLHPTVTYCCSPTGSQRNVKGTLKVSQPTDESNRQIPGECNGHYRTACPAQPS
jgi:hypothetical protein